MCDITRDEADELNARACPLIYPTAEEVNKLIRFMRQTFPDKYVADRLYHFTKSCVVRDRLFKVCSSIFYTFH